MMPLPHPDCEGCPMAYQGKSLFTPDQIQERAPVMVVTQHAGEWQGLDKHLGLAGLTRDDISLGSAIRCQRYTQYNTPPLDTVTMKALDFCRKAHFSPPAGARLIVSQGALPLYQLTGEKSVAEWRGWLQPLKDMKDGQQLSSPHTSIYEPDVSSALPVLAVLPPSAVSIQPEMGFITRLDWGKVARYLAGKWPQKMPPIETEPPRTWPKLAAADTEFHWRAGGKPHESQVYRYSLAENETRRLWVVESSPKPPKIVVPAKSTLILHNALADWQFFSRLLAPWNNVKVEDTMLLHSVLWSGMSREKEEDSRAGKGLGHGLDFLASVYGSLNRHKHLSLGNPVVYAGADALVTLDLWQGLSRELEADSGSQFVYRECVLPLIPIILEAEIRGLKVNKDRLHPVADSLQNRIDQATLRAQAAVGWPINLASNQQIGKQLYEVEGLKVKKEKKR